MFIQEDTGTIELNNGQDYLVWRLGEGKTVEIFDILIRTEKRKGTGRELIRLLKEKFPDRKLYLFTRESNQIAHYFYQALGFRVSQLPSFYGDGDKDARIYFE